MLAVMIRVALAAAPVQVVVPDARVVSGADPGQGALVAEEIASALPTSAFKVTTSAQLAAVLGLERQRQLAGCNEGSSCVAELASALGADVVAQATLAKVSSGLRCDVAFIAGRDGATLEHVTVGGANDSELLSKLHDEIQSIAAPLYQRQRPGNVLLPGSPGVRRYAWVPGVVGLALAAAGGVLFGVTASMWSSLTTRELTTSQARDIAAGGRTFQSVSWAVAGVGAAALVAAAALFVAGAPTQPRVMVAPVSGAAPGVSLSGVWP